MFLVMLLLCPIIFRVYPSTIPVWWLIPLSKWVITPVISGLILLITHLRAVGSSPPSRKNLRRWKICSDLSKVHLGLASQSRHNEMKDVDLRNQRGLDQDANCHGKPWRNRETQEFLGKFSDTSSTFGQFSARSEDARQHRLETYSTL